MLYINLRASQGSYTREDLLQDFQTVDYQQEQQPQQQDAVIEGGNDLREPLLENSLALDDDGAQETEINQGNDQNETSVPQPDAV